MLLEAYNLLPVVDKQALVIAFNNRETYIVFIADDFFIGVWVTKSECLKVLEEKNNWSYGEKICPI